MSPHLYFHIINVNAVHTDDHIDDMINSIENLIYDYLSELADINNLYRKLRRAYNRKITKAQIYSNYMGRIKLYESFLLMLKFNTKRITTDEMGYIFSPDMYDYIFNSKASKLIEQVIELLTNK